MNNNVKFDPMTGEPLQNNNQQTLEPVTPIIDPQTIQQPIEQNTIVNETQNNTNQEIQVQNQLQNIPTVDQSKEEFINNAQSINKEKKEEKKEGVNFIFIIILFVVILITIYFLFPLLLDYI